MTTVATPKMAHARAPVKINVFLKAGAKLSNGDREVATAYQALSLCEDVRAYPANDFSVSFTGTVDTSGVATDGSNLAIRAATLLARKTGYRRGARLEIGKHVPVAGGMGGGSADARRRSWPATRCGERNRPASSCSPSRRNSERTCPSRSPAARRSAPVGATS